MNREKTFNAADIVFANIVRCGRELVSVKLTGVSSLPQLISYLRTLVGDTLGRVVLKIRNFSQGWRLEQPLMLRPAEGRQLSLF